MVRRLAPVFGSAYTRGDYVFAADDFFHPPIFNILTFWESNYRRIALYIFKLVTQIGEKIASGPNPPSGGLTSRWPSLTVICIVLGLNKKHLQWTRDRDRSSQAVTTSEEDNMKDKAYKICRDFLSGTWKSISSSDMVFKSLNGGLSNVLYYCSLPETHTSLVGEPNQVLLRMYGQIHEGRVDATITESVIFMMLSERKLGPKLYGIFPGGRLEEYIPARALTCQELRDPEISAVIARKLARVHTLQVPINKEPSWLFDKLDTWLEYIRKNVILENMSRERRAVAEKVLSVDLKEEIAWLKSFLRKVDSPVVFSHNDLQEGNILLPDGPQDTEDRLVFIDFEYCSYNFRGFDLGNHFCEWGYDYSSPVYPHYTTTTQEYPSLQEQLNFVRAYLSAMDPPVNQEESVCRQHTDTENHLLEEANAFVLASHMLWALWAIFQANTSKITFGYLEYSASRMEAYFRWKRHLLSLPSVKRNKEGE